VSGDQPAGRIVAVLGYSDGRSEGLHPICAARLECAAELAAAGDLVVLSGWARRRSRLSEAELMRSAWPGPSASVVCDEAARTTAENARAVASLARRRGAREVLVVTSAWHAPRARLLFRAALRGSGVRVEVAPAGEDRPLRPTLGEAVRWPLVPLQLALARRLPAL
jgi:uncharacterized SAM-binding protein YcdF (DUF218 family)